MNCYMVRFRAFPYLTASQYMLTFAPDEHTAIRNVVDSFWKRKVVITPLSVELDSTPVWDRRRENIRPVRVRKRGAAR